VSFLFTGGYWQSALEIGLPVAFAALGVVITSRAGFLNVGVEGVMLLGAFFTVAGGLWTDSFVLALIIGSAAAVVGNVLCVWLSYRLKMGTVLAGLGLNIAVVGITSFFSQRWFSAGTSGVGDLAPKGVDYVAAVLLVICALAVDVFMRRTHGGLIVSAVGERADVAAAFGVSAFAVRVRSAVAGGVLIGLGGGLLALVAVGSFVDNIVSGRGFIALACVILCGWRPLGVLLAAGLFGMTDALHFTLSASGTGAGQVLVVLPYVATVVAIGLLWGRSRGPAEEAMFLEPQGAER
jgi:ABC-type uncharacterized transport system permease subunit